MRHYFFDSSTFLKLFVVEAGANRVREIVRGAELEGNRLRVSVCDLAHPECVSAMRQMLERGVGGRMGLIPKRGANPSGTRTVTTATVAWGRPTDRRPSAGLGCRDDAG